VFHKQAIAKKKRKQKNKQPTTTPACANTDPLKKAHTQNQKGTKETITKNVLM